MGKNPEIRQQLTEDIAQRQQAVRAFLKKTRPRRDRLTNISVIGSALAAVLTVGPAVGGTKFTAFVQSVFSLSDASLVWRILCLAAVLLSLAAALATNLANSHSVASRVNAAEACNTQLEGLQTALKFGHLSVDDAVELYRQYTGSVAFVEDTADK